MRDYDENVDFTNIKFVVDNDLCTCCGTCAGLCPESAIQMMESPGGLLLPRIDTERCTKCRICVLVCPGWKVEKIWPELTDAYKGQALSAFLVHAVDPQSRLESQSAGAVTALCGYLLSCGEVDGVLVTEMPVDGSLRPKPFIARSAEDLKKARGSKYCPTGSNAGLRRVNLEESIALVGLGCHIHGLRRAEMNMPNRVSNVKVAIGLICEGMMGFGSMDYLVEKSGLKRDEVESLRFKNKKFGGWPGDTSVKLFNGEERRVSKKHRLASKFGFGLPRCMLCWDKLNIGADITAGDPWGICNDKEGFNVLIARTEKGNKIVRNAISKGFLVGELLDIEMINRGQNIEVRRKSCSGSLNAWKEMGRLIPEVPFDFKIGNAKFRKKQQKLLNQKLEQVNSGTCEEAFKFGCRCIERARQKKLLSLVFWKKSIHRLIRQLRNIAGF